MRPAAAADATASSSCREVPEVLSFLVARGRAWTRRRPTRRSTWAPATPLYCAAGAGGEVVALAAGLGPARAASRGASRRVRAQVMLEPVGVRFDGGELELSA